VRTNAGSARASSERSPSAHHLGQHGARSNRNDGTGEWDDELTKALQQPYSGFHQLWRWVKKRIGGR
jgi:transposase